MHSQNHSNHHQQQQQQQRRQFLPPPQRTNRAFHVNPSPHEIAVGSVEQWRRSKLSKAWKNVLISLVKEDSTGSSSSGGVILYVWRDNISVDGTSNVLEIIQQIPLTDVSSVNVHDQDNFSLSLFLTTTNLEESQVVTFRCLEEPEAAQDWVTTLRTVHSHVVAKKKQQQQQNAGAGTSNGRGSSAPSKPAITHPAS